MLKNNLKYTTIIGFMLLTALLTFGSLQLHMNSYQLFISDHNIVWTFELISYVVIFIIGIIGSIGIIAKYKWGQILSIVTLIFSLIVYLITINIRDEIISTITELIVIGFAFIFIFLLLINENLGKELVTKPINADNLEL